MIQTVQRPDGSYDIAIDNKPTNDQTRVTLTLLTERRVDGQRGWWRNPELGSSLWAIEAHHETNTSVAIEATIQEALGQDITTHTRTLVNGLVRTIL